MDYPRLFTLFQEDHSLIQDNEIRELECHHVGNLVVISGKLLACDPYYCPDTEPFAAELIPPGQYPVLLSIAHIGERDQRVALAALLIDETLPVNWKIAVPSGIDVRGREEYSYCVDSAIGCFMDADAVAPFTPICEDYDDNTDPILQTMEKTGWHGTASWANVCVNEETGVNIIAFTSGWGDGGYPSYFGYDENEQIVCLITDFCVLEQKE